MRRYRRKYIVRRKTARSKMKAASKPEVKYNTFIVDDAPINIAYPGALTDNMYANQFRISNLLGNIPLGTGRGDRIGNKIYVKFIQLTIWTHACPGATNYDVGSYHLRIIVANTGQNRLASNTIVPKFFAPPVMYQFNALINRNLVNVRYDKTYHVRATESATTALVPFNLCGASKRLHITIPIGRVIDFQEGTAGMPRNDADYLCLYMMVGVPGSNLATNGLQVCCNDIISRVYYTDV